MNRPSGDSAKTVANDRIEQRPPPSGLRWTMILTWFMRFLAIIWILKGLSAWAAILGISSNAFEQQGTGYQAMLIYFAVIDLVAAVGLWIASAWGGMLWLLAVMSQVILAAFFPRLFTSGIATTTVLSLTVLVYVFVSWLAAREEG